MRWQPIDSALTIRATYSEAYHAPTLSDLFRGVELGIADCIFDPRSPATASEVATDFSGNRNLQPETAYEWTYGAVVTPGKWWSPLQGLTLQADFYHIDLRAVTAILDPQFLVNHEDQFPGQVIRGPSTGPDDPFGPIVLLLLPEQNLGRIIQEGWDYEMAYSFDTSRLGHGDWGTLTATFNGTYIDRVVLQAGCWWTGTKCCRQVRWRLPRGRRRWFVYAQSLVRESILRRTGGLTAGWTRHRLYRALHRPVLGH